jgi:acyl-CoA synthetase (AMP-forming)/AMP-acid ligase II
LTPQSIDPQQQVTSAFGAPLHIFCASTEAAGNLTFGLRPGPVMRIVERAQVRLADKNGCDAADGEIGDLLLRGANVFDGYWNDPRATAKSLKGEWYHTGDLMRRGEKDELMFVARKKDIIIRGGTNMSPIEVEQAIVGCRGGSGDRYPGRRTRAARSRFHQACEEIQRGGRSRNSRKSHDTTSRL